MPNNSLENIDQPKNKFNPILATGLRVALVLALSGGAIWSFIKVSEMLIAPDITTEKVDKSPKPIENQARTQESKDAIAKIGEGIKVVDVYDLYYTEKILRPQVPLIDVKSDSPLTSAQKKAIIAQVIVDFKIPAPEANKVQIALARRYESSKDKRFTSKPETANFSKPFYCNEVQFLQVDNRALNAFIKAQEINDSLSNPANLSFIATLKSGPATLYNFQSNPEGTRQSIVSLREEFISSGLDAEFLLRYPNTLHVSAKKSN
jgi:hypothetical protein